jgi:serine protease SohB
MTGQILAEYLLFLGKTATIVIAVVAVLLVITRLRQRRREDDHIEVSKLNEKYERMADAIQGQVLSKHGYKQRLKELKQKRKAALKPEKTGAAPRKHVYVLDFDGDIKASAVTHLREEITAILTVATPDDEVFLRLESGGGMVHAYGFASSQLQRLRDRGIPLTVAVDKVAASGGYMMACVADRLIAAPFAIVGSIGVIAQLPNFNRLLKKNNIEFEQITAGEFKRTLTLFGENTEAGRTKLKEEIEDTHSLFKDLIVANRKQIDIGRVATGEYWYGSRALELKLVDELMTSDDYLFRAGDTADLYQVAYVEKKNLTGRLLANLPRSLQRAASMFRP